MKKLIIATIMATTSMSTMAAQPFGAGAGYDIGFSPRGGALNLVITGIKAARSQILVSAYSFTSKPIAYALVDAQRRGVKVFVIGDQQQNSNNYTALTYLANNGVPVALNGHYQDFHDKYMIIDGMHVETGSFNFSAAATKNAENAVILWNVPQIAATYTSDWQEHWRESTPVKGNY